MKSVSWWQRRWFDFRTGHGTYFGQLLSVVNFVMLAYTFLVLRLMDNIPILVILFPTIVHFAVVFGILYFILAEVAGYVHRKKQLMTEQIAMTIENKYVVEQAKAWYALVLQLGNDTAIKYFEDSLTYLGVNYKEVKRQVEEDVKEASE